MNRFATTNSPTQPETCRRRRVPNFLRGKHRVPRCSRRHRLLLSAKPLPPKSSQYQLGPRLSQDASHPSAELTSFLHPHIHTLPTAPVSRERGLGSGVPARAFLRSRVDPFQRGTDGGWRHVLLPVSQQLRSAAP